MSSSTASIDLLVEAQRGKEITANALFSAASPAMLFARRDAGCIALTWAYYGGVYNAATIANGSLTLVANATNYVEASATGIVSVNQVGFTGGKLPLYAVVTGSSTATSWIDYRQAIGAAGGGSGAGLDTVNSFTRAQSVTPVAAVSGAVVTLDAGASNNHKVALTGNTTIANPTGLTDGEVLNIRITNGGTYTLSWGTKFRWPGGVAPAMTSGAGKVDLVSGVYYADIDAVLCSYVQDVR